MSKIPSAFKVSNVEYKITYGAYFNVAFGFNNNHDNNDNNESYEESESSSYESQKFSNSSETFNSVDYGDTASYSYYDSMSQSY